MQKEIKLFALFLITFLVFSTFVYAAGSSTNDDDDTDSPRPSASQTRCENSGGTWSDCAPTNCEYKRAVLRGESVGSNAMCIDGCDCGEDKCWNGQSCELTVNSPETACANSGGEWKRFSQSCADSCELARNPELVSCAMASTRSCDCGETKCWNGQTCEVTRQTGAAPQTDKSCADRATRTDRIKCRLENKEDTKTREPDWVTEESCKNLVETAATSETKTRITKGLCRALYATSKQCYQMQKEGDATQEEVEKCFQRAAGLEKRVSQDFGNKEAVRKYLVLRLYNVQEKIEEAQEAGTVDVDKAAQAIELIVKIKEKIMNGENKEVIRPLILGLKTKIQEMRNHE